MSGQDLRNIMNLMESVQEAPEQIEESINGMDTDALLWKLFEFGRDAEGIRSSNAEAKAAKLIEELIAIVGPTVGSVSEAPVFEDETLEETGNANAQQKGINFSGTPASKNKGDMDLSSPKSKAAGSKTPLAQAKSGTNVGKIKS